VNPIFDAVSAAAGQTVGKVFDRLAGLIPAGEEEKAKLRLEAEKMAADMAAAETAQRFQEDESFRNFVLGYEGKAEAMPPAIQILRSSVRPLLSYLLVTTTAWLVWHGQPIPTELHQLDLLCLAFWFGERAVRNYIRTRDGRDVEAS
jgi:hypothetical protein